MRREMHYVGHPDFLWSHIADLARTQSDDLLATLGKGFNYIENESFGSDFDGLFSEINLNSEKLGKTAELRNRKLQTVISRIAAGLDQFSTDTDILGDAYEYLIGRFAAGSGKKGRRVLYSQEAFSQRVAEPTMRYAELLDNLKAHDKL